MDGSRREGREEARGASPVMALVILIGMVIVGAALVFVAAGDLLESIDDRADVERAELSMIEAKNQLETVAFQDDTSTTVHVENGGIEADGEVEFATNGTDASGAWHRCSRTVALGSLVEETAGDERVVYQGGGVWRTTGDTSTMTSKPSLRYRTETVDGDEVPSVRFPVVAIEGAVGGSDTYVARTNESRSSRAAFQETLCLAGPDAIEQIHDLEITIRDSSVIDAWERYARDEFDDDSATVEGVDEGESGAVTITVTWNPDGSSLVGALERTIYGGLSANGGDVSVNDTEFTVTDAAGNADWLTVDGDVDFGGSAAVNGYLAVEGAFTRQGDATKCPDVLFAESSDGEGADACSVDGDPEFESIDPIDGQVLDAIDTLERSTAADPAVAGTLEAGQYYTADDLTLSGQVDTTDGDVEIGVDDGSTLTVADLEVIGDGQVRIYTDGDVRIEGTTDGHDGESLWVYGTGGATVRFGENSPGGVHFSGVVYAPGDGTGTLEFAADTDVEGAVVGGVLVADGAHDVTVEYDDATRTDAAVDEETAASASLEFVTHEVAEEVEVIEEGQEALPLDVVFVLDRSGSMDPPDSDLEYFVEHDAGHYEPIYEGPAGESPLIDDSSGDHRTYVDGDTSRHRIYVEDGDDWVSIDDSSVGREVDRGPPQYRFYEIPDAQEIRITQAGYDPNGVRFDATEDFVDGVLDESLDDRAGYVDFAADGRIRQPLTTDYDDVRDAFDEESTGGTNVGAGLEDGLSLYDRDEGDSDRVMILLSDGENSNWWYDDRALEAADAAAQANVTIYTIGLNDEADDDLLGEIADVTGGEYFLAEDADALLETFDEVRDAVGERDTRYIEQKTVETRVGDGPIDVDATGSYELSPGEPKDVTVVSYDCDGTVSTNETAVRDGTTYEYRECADVDESRAYEINASLETAYTVYEDGDRLDDYEGGWWQTGLASTLEGDGLVDATDEFDLEANERVIVLRYESDGETDAPTGYVAFTLTLEPPTFADGFAESGRSGSNTYVVTVAETRIVVEG